MIAYVQSDGSDYSDIGTIQLTFDMNNSEFPINIGIIDDVIHERVEDFFAQLTTDDGDITLDPMGTTVRILDNDGTTAMNILCVALIIASSLM